VPVTLVDAITKTFAIDHPDYAFETTEPRNKDIGGKTEEHKLMSHFDMFQSGSPSCPESWQDFRGPKP
jgi:hypothetical protein